jgi:hypothetical protein
LSKPLKAKDPAGAPGAMPEGVAPSVGAVVVSCARTEPPSSNISKATLNAHPKAAIDVMRAAVVNLVLIFSSGQDSVSGVTQSLKRVSES